MPAIHVFSAARTKDVDGRNGPVHDDEYRNFCVRHSEGAQNTSGQAEGAAREFAVLTQKFSGADGKVKKLHCVKVDDKFKPLPGTELELDAELVLLAMGFVHPVHEGLLKLLGVDLDQRGNVRANLADYQTSRPNVFSAGDMRRGQSLVVWAIREGRLCAQSIDKFLMGKTDLPR